MRPMAGRADLSGEVPNHLRAFVRFEQENLWKPERFRLPGKEMELGREYLAETGAVFRLPSFWIKRKHLYVYGQQGWISREWQVMRGAGPEDRALFPIHPAELVRCQQTLVDAKAEDAALGGIELLATPTASGRTLVAWIHGQPGSASFVKASLKRGVFGDRRLRREVVARSVGLSAMVQRVQPNLPPGMSYLHEPLGLVPRRMPDGGVLFRILPREVADGSVIPAPLFALMGGRGGRQPLLLELIGRDRGLARHFVEEVLLRKFARIWVDLVFDWGLILEAHAQDLMCALSRDGIPTGQFYYRDFEGLAVDWELRRIRGLGETTELPNEWQWHTTYDTWGYPLYQMVSTKLKLSLRNYVNLFLAELESALMEWQANGALNGFEVGQHELTSSFSDHLCNAMKEKFGSCGSPDCNLRDNLAGFVKYLMKVRMEVMRGVGCGR
jgi:IucA / IucC family